MKNRNILLPASIFMILVTAPFLYAALASGQQSIFGGFLLNPQDGNSYLAKMEIGQSGAWLFHLPYSVETGSGAALFLFYIALGHLAAWLSLPLLVVFHAARILADIFLVYSLYIFIQEAFPAPAGTDRQRAFLLALFGAGLGWLVFLSGWIPGDLWVAEGYPFLASYSNPHFPLGIALLLWILILANRPVGRRTLLILPVGLLLSSVLPFGVVIGGVVVGIQAAWEFWETRRLQWQALVCLGLGGGSFLLYQYLAITADPVLAAWNSQNQTPALPLYDFLLSFSPAILLAVPGAAQVWKRHDRSLLRTALIWLAAGAVLTYLPINIQRRFISGYEIPVALLAVVGVRWLAGRLPRRLALFRIVFLLSVPSLAVVLWIGFFGVARTDSLFYFQRSEAEAFDWLHQNTPADSVIVAAPESGMFIPAYTGRKVVYGHPYETILAAERKALVEAFYAGQSGSAIPAWMTALGVDFIVYGPRERALGQPALLANLQPVFQAGDVEIYALP